MTESERDRYLAAYDFVFPGHDDSPDDATGVAEAVVGAESADHAAWMLAGWGYHQDERESASACLRSARALRAALGVVEADDATVLAAKLAAVRAVVYDWPHPSDAAHDYASVLLDAVRRAIGAYDPLWLGDVGGYSETLYDLHVHQHHPGGRWVWWRGSLPNEMRRRSDAWDALPHYDTAEEAQAAAVASVRGGR